MKGRPAGTTASFHRLCGRCAAGRALQQRLPLRLPSDRGMPLCLLEPMSYGNCVITSDIEECYNVIHDNGIVFRKGDVDDLARSSPTPSSIPMRCGCWVARRRLRLHPSRGIRSW
ncbi:MAG: glycosyltransferase [Faecalibacterium prausnitzii]